MDFALTLVNKRIFDYYAANPHVDFLEVNLRMIDLMEMVKGSQSETVTKSQTAEILEHVRVMTQQRDINHDQLLRKLQDYNQLFVDNMTLRINNDTNQNINRQTDVFTCKLHDLLKEANEPVHRKIIEFQEHLKEELERLADGKKTANNSAETKEELETLINKLQQPLCQLLVSNQTQVQAQLVQLRDETVGAKNIQDRLSTDLHDFLAKHNSSSQFKGQYSEKQLESLLNQMFPTAEVLNTTGLKANGDFMLKRENKVTILIENKNYERNVNLDETTKFVRDVSVQRTSGIMMSQKSGIVGKPNFFIEINNGNVLIYLHHVDYTPEKVQLAVDVIDNLAAKLANLDATTNIVVDKETLDNINRDMQNFLQKKEKIIVFAKDTHKQLLVQLDELALPNLALYLSDKFASVAKPPTSRKKSAVKVTPSSSISSSSSNIHIKTPVANSEFATFFKNVGMKTVDSGSGSGGESDTEAKRLRTI
jgi:hypothetical protein